MKFVSGGPDERRRQNISRAGRKFARAIRRYAKDARANLPLARLNLGARSLEDVFDATLGADISYWSLPDRKTCVICGKSRGTCPPEADAPTRAEGYGKITVPLCSPGCRQAYREWLRD